MDYKTSEEERARVKAYYQSHTEECKAYRKAYYQKNKARLDAQAKRYRQEHKEQMRKYHHRYHLEHRIAEKTQALEAYGGATCSCCGELHVEFLTLDHINGGGRKHRQEIRRQGFHFYSWLRLHGYPSGFRVLCMNCNLSLGLYKYCPHGVTP